MITAEEVSLTPIVRLLPQIGMLPDHEFAVIFNLWNEVGGNFLEIGTSSGLTTRALALGKPWAKVFTVDVLSPNDVHENQRNEHPGSQLGYFSMGLPNVFRFANGSENFDAKNKGIRMVYIDGDHREGSVWRDSELVMALGGEGERFIIAWHDYEDNGRDDCSWLGVGPAVRRLAARYGLAIKHAKDTRIAFWRSWQHA